MRLNRYLAQAGLGSRRAVEDLITGGAVTIGGRVVRDLATQIEDDRDDVVVDGRPVRPARRLSYIAMNKPKGYDVTRGGTNSHRRAYDLLPEGTHASVQSVGRLDRDSTGLLIFTNDGELAFRLAHPRFECQKTYLAHVSPKASREAIDELVQGVVLEDGPARAIRAALEPCDIEGTSIISIVMGEGRNRIVRRMCDAIGHPVLALHRTQVGPLRIGDLKNGRTRELTKDEVIRLKASVKLN